MTRRAFSLVELVIALAILAVGLVGAMRVFPVGLRVSQRAEARSRAVMAAQRTLELLKLTPWDELADGEAVVEEEGFTITTTVRAPAADLALAPERLRVVEVGVAWTRGGKPQQVRCVTYLRQPRAEAG